MRIDIPTALRDLARLADRIAELIEWRKLAQQERRLPFCTSFDLDLHLDMELSDLQICFADADFSLREVLRRTDLGISDRQREQWFRELRQLEKHVPGISPPADL